MHKSVLSAEAQNNLVELSEYLKVYAKQNAIHKKPIDFGLDIFFQEESDIKDYECGASACAVGHFAVMRGYAADENGVFIENNVVCKNGLTVNGGVNMGWRDFSKNVIGVSTWGEQQIIWNWLFSSGWCKFDNTPLGVAARIEYFLEHGVPDGDGINDVFGMNVKKLLSTYLERREALERECGIV